MQTVNTLDSIQVKVLQLHHLNDLKSRIDAFNGLFRRTPTIYIRGIFKDEKGTDCFCHNGWHLVRELKAKWFRIEVDDTLIWCRLSDDPNYEFDAMLEVNE